MAKETKPVVHVRTRKSQPTTEYDYDQHGKVEGGGMSPKFITQEFIDQVSLEGPRGWDEAKSPFTVRIWPAINPDNTEQFMKYRKVDAPQKFTDWFRAIPSVKYVGVGKNKQITFFIYDPRRVHTENYEVSSNPYMILFQEFHSAVKADQAMLGKRDVLTKYWYNMAMDSKVREKRAFCKPTITYLFQGTIYSNNKSLVRENGLPMGLGRKDRTPIGMLSKAAGDELVRLVRLPSKNPSEDPTNVSSQFIYGDITRLKAGKFVSFYHPSLSDIMAAKYPKDIQLASELAPKSEESEGNRGFDSYEVLLHNTCSVIPEKQKRPVVLTPDISEHADSIRAHYMWWDDILYFPGHEEMCVMLAQAYRDVPDIIRYCWRDNREFMTAEVKAILSSAVSGPGADIPGADDDDDPVDDEDAPSPSRKAKTSAAIPANDEDYSEFVEDEDDEAASVADFTEEEDDEAATPASAKSSLRKKVERKAKQEEAEAEAEDDDEDDAPAPPPPKPKPKPAASAKAPVKPLPLPGVKKTSVKPPPKQQAPADDDDDSSEEEVLQALAQAKNQSRKRR